MSDHPNLILARRLYDEFIIGLSHEDQKAVIETLKRITNAKRSHRALELAEKAIHAGIDAFLRDHPAKNAPSKSLAKRIDGEWRHQVGLLSKEEQSIIDSACAFSLSGKQKNKAGVVIMADVIYGNAMWVGKAWINSGAQSKEECATAILAGVSKAFWRRNSTRHATLINAAEKQA
jgi:hypothetical protein